MQAWLETPGSRPHAVCGQEVKLLEEELLAARRSLSRGGWNASFAPGVATRDEGDGRHRSAGTIVAVPSHVQSETLWPFEREDLSPVEAPGRLSGRWANLMGGVAVLSMYMQDVVGWGEVNLALARQLESVVANLTCPWILGLDANMEPEAFASNAVISSLRGIIVAPEEGTCRYRDIWKKYDYFSSMLD